MIYLASLAAILVLGLLGLFSLLSKNMAPGKKRFEMETKRLREDMDQWVTKLVPIDKEELELFSLGQDKQVLRKGVTTTAKGIYTTIYHEPVLAYSYREYLGKAEKPNALLYARTAEHEYTYWIKKGDATLFIDGQEVGQLANHGVLKGKRTGKVIAQIKSEAGNLLPVEVGGREVGSLAKNVAKADKGLHDRAFSFLRNDLSAKEEQLLLALALEELVSRAVR